MKRNAKWNKQLQLWAATRRNYKRITLAAIPMAHGAIPRIVSVCVCVVVRLFVLFCCKKCQKKAGMDEATTGHQPNSTTAEAHTTAATSEQQNKRTFIFYHFECNNNIHSAHHRLVDRTERRRRRARFLKRKCRQNGKYINFMLNRRAYLLGEINVLTGCLTIRIYVYLLCMEEIIAYSMDVLTRSLIQKCFGRLLASLHVGRVGCLMWWFSVLCQFDLNAFNLETINVALATIHRWVGSLAAGPKHSRESDESDEH